jgi:hypothetical protein
MQRDVIVVHIAKALDRCKSVEEATAGDWLVSLHSAPRLKYIIGVGRGSIVKGVFEITDFHVVPSSKHRDRVEWHGIWGHHLADPDQ